MVKKLVFSIVERKSSRILQAVMMEGKTNRLYRLLAPIASKIVFEPEKIKAQLKRFLVWFHAATTSILIFTVLWLNYSYRLEVSDVWNFVFNKQALVNKLHDDLALVKQDVETVVGSREWKVMKIKDEAKVIVPSYVTNDELESMLRVADFYDLPYSIWFRLIWNESRFQGDVVSSTGARGYAQIMPQTFRDYVTAAEKRSGKKIAQLKACGFLLRCLHDSEIKAGWKGDNAWKRVLSRYNCGRVDFDLTGSYVKLIMSNKLLQE